MDAADNGPPKAAPPSGGTDTGGRPAKLDPGVVEYRLGMVGERSSGDEGES